jgi:glycosyltransferase involved in cell wall biosynthesis
MLTEGLTYSPLVSVVMPSFNQGDFIEASILSVLSQSHERLELIVMDGASTDQTVDILQKIRSQDHRLRWYSEPDTGPAHAINKALDLTRGTVLGWLNSDDLYFEGAIKRALEAFDGCDNPLMVYGQAVHIDGSGAHCDDYPTQRPGVGRAALAKGCFVCQPTVFIKKVAAHLLGPLDQDLKTAFDFDWWLRAFDVFDGRIEFVDELQAASRLHPLGITHKQRALVALEAMYLIKKHLGWLNSTWLISYLNEAQDVGEFVKRKRIHDHLNEELKYLFTDIDLKIIHKLLHADQSDQWAT